jgi:hypothetical protein
MSNGQIDTNKIVTHWITTSDSDDYKQAFYYKCTKEFTSQWIENIKTLRLWIKEKL